MSRIVLVLCLPLAVMATLRSELSADDHADFRLAWSGRLAQHASVHYQVSGVKRSWNTDGKQRVVHRTELRLDARLKIDERKFRFDTKVNDGTTSLCILDRREYHTCLKTAGGAWQAKSSPSIEPESDWPDFYPILLAHGVVPLPPFAVPRIPPRDPQSEQSQDRPDVRNRETIFTFDGDSALTVTITHDSNGLLSSYRVSDTNRQLVHVSNTYERAGNEFRLSQFFGCRIWPRYPPRCSP